MSLVILKRTKNYFELCLNREEKLNALSLDLLKELKNCLELIEKNKETRFVVFKGAKSVFCVGADLVERNAFSEAEVDVFLNLLNEICNHIEDSKKIFFAFIQKYALGGGLELALSCDFLFALNSAIIGFPESTIGVIPGSGGTQRISKFLKIQMAKELIFTGKKISALDGKKLGIIHECFESEFDFNNYLQRFLGEMQNTAPLSVEIAKKAINFQFSKNRKEFLDFERACYKRLVSTDDRKEGLNAFFEKRKPQFLGK